MKTWSSSSGCSERMVLVSIVFLARDHPDVTFIVTNSQKLWRVLCSSAVGRTTRAPGWGGTHWGAVKRHLLELKMFTLL